MQLLCHSLHVNATTTVLLTLNRHKGNRSCSQERLLCDLNCFLLFKVQISKIRCLVLLKKEIHHRPWYVADGCFTLVEGRDLVICMIMWLKCQLLLERARLHSYTASPWSDWKIISFWFVLEWNNWREHAAEVVWCDEEYNRIVFFK